MKYKNIQAVSIDDNQQNLMLVEAYANEIGVENVKNFLNPIEALEFLKTNDVDIVFIDYMMPELNGVELIQEYRKYNKDVPIIMITAVGDDEDLRIDALEKGATDFLKKPLDYAEFNARVNNLLALRIAQLKLQDKALLLEDEIKEATKEIANREYETLRVLGKTAEYKDPETASHIARVAHYSKLLAKKYGLSKKEQEVIFYASPFHDIGKVGIPDAILLKPAKLTDDEFDVMRTHAFIGYDILKDSESKFLQEGAIIALNHHEKYNGCGYPNKVKGKDIPLSGRIVAIADVFDALTSKRPYKKAWSFESAQKLLEDEKGEHFDPELVDIFIKNIDEVRKIYEKFQED